MNIDSTEDFNVIQVIPYPPESPIETIVLVKLNQFMDYQQQISRAKFHYGKNATIHRTYWTSGNFLKILGLMHPLTGFRFTF